MMIFHGMVWKVSHTASFFRIQLYHYIGNQLDHFLSSCLALFWRLWALYFLKNSMNHYQRISQLNSDSSISDYIQCYCFFSLFRECQTLSCFFFYD